MTDKKFMSVLCERDNRIHGLYAVWARKHNINYNILAVLCSVHNQSGCTQKHICDEWCLAKQTVNTTCKELIGMGLLISEQSLTSKRETTLRLTEKGIAFSEPLFEELQKIEERIYAKMGSTKVQKFMELYAEYAELAEAEFEKSIADK